MMMLRRLMRKRWVLGVVFGLSLIYFLTSTLKQDEQTVRDRTLLEVRDTDRRRRIPWKVRFNLGNSSRQITQCRNSIQGKTLLTDELGYVCERKDLLVNGCCNVNAASSRQHVCKSCLANGCCSIYEYCVSCCLQPDKVADICVFSVSSIHGEKVRFSGRDEEENVVGARPEKLTHCPLTKCFVKSWLTQIPKRNIHPLTVMFSRTQLLLERFLNRAAEGFQNLFTAVEDHFELCLAKCRTSSQSVQHENTYRNPQAKYCYGESPPELLPI